MQRLYEIGFQRAGRWSLKGNELFLQLENLADRQNVLYAFVTGNTLKYVGKTTQTLQRRMFGYQKPNVDQRTNWRNRIAIVDLLKRGQPVEILALADAGLLRYGSFHLNLAAGLEDSIIQTLKPEWNGGRTSAAIEALTEANPPDTSGEAKLEAQVHEVAQQLAELNPPRQHTFVVTSTEANPAAQAIQTRPEPTVHLLTPVAETRPHKNTPNPESKTLEAAPYFVLTLQNTYHRTGFFNVPLNCDRYFGPDTAKITIYCGREKLAVTGHINRTANTNGTPRIMGAVPLRQWFQKRRPMSHLKVSILGPTTIHINDA
ncbi:GIY-YIG nuclease family protein [Massilia sp.]|uniref:GIY-YIG nuclease family protein n=1 Tax=Massilia sp. TaxID=1882437 RepID=UPI0028A6D4B1|nr:GIY-YIG nuclease family protein [Massilia sp.]